MARPDGFSGWTLVEQLLGSRATEAAELVADRLLKPCVCCSRKAIPIDCKFCGAQVCAHHGYFNVGRREVICQLCERDVLGEAAGVTPDIDHWEVLGFDGPTSRQLINRAFRIKSRSCHPDRYPNDTQKAKEWRRLQWARDLAFEEATSF